MSATRTLLGSIGLLVLVACGSSSEEGAPPPEGLVAPTPTTTETPPSTPPPTVPTDFAIASNGGPLVLRAKTPLSFDVAIERKSGFSGDVLLEVANLPAGVTANITQPGAGNTGKVTLTFGVATVLGDYELEIVGRANEVAHATKRSLIVAGYVGTLDDAFGAGGYLTYPIDLTPQVMRVDSAGRMLVAGTNAPSKKAYFARYTSIGKPGWKPGELSSKYLDYADAAISSVALELAVLPSGDFFVAGQSTDKNNLSRACVAKMTSTGDRDTTWGEAGVRCFLFGSGQTDVIARLAVLPDGGLLALGAADTDLGIAKLTAKGDLDTTFAGTGKKLIARSALQEPHQIAQDSKGRVVVDAYCHDVASACIFRFEADGKVDTSFKGGVVLPKINGSSAWTPSMVIGSSDEIYLAGQAKSAGDTGFAALDPSGGPLQTFGTNGWMTRAFGAPSAIMSLSFDNERLVAGGALPNNAVALTAVDLSGTVDPTLPENGFPTVPGVSGTLRATALLPARAMVMVHEPNYVKIYRVWR